MSGPSDGLDEAIDRLYQLPLAEFTEARNQLTAARRAGGDPEGVLRVKALAKPSVVAWAANQVYWLDREAFQEVVEAVRDVLVAQRGALGEDTGIDLRAATRRKGEALQAALRSAARRMREGGGKPGPGLEEGLAATLEALAVSEVTGGGNGPRPGRLTAELQPPGFDTAFGLAAVSRPDAPRGPGAGAAPVTPKPHSADSRAAAAPVEPDGGDRAARARLLQAEAELARLGREVAAAVTHLGEAEQRAAAARADVSSLEERLLGARERVQARTRDEEGARAQLADLRRALAKAESECETARALVPRRPAG